MRLAEIGDPVVVAATDFAQQLAIRYAVPEKSLARLQHRAPDAVFFVFNEHRSRVVGALADIFPDAEEVDLRGVFKALPGLHDGAQRADLLAFQHPGVVFAARRRLAPLHMRRAIAQFGGEPARVTGPPPGDGGVGRDDSVIRHTHLPRGVPAGSCRSLDAIIIRNAKRAAGFPNSVRIRGCRAPSRRPAIRRRPVLALDRAPWRPPWRRAFPRKSADSPGRTAARHWRR